MKRAFGVIRVSQAKGREGESFISPEDQRRRINDKCGGMGLELIATAEEIDVSGGKPLADRPGLREGVEAIEAGHAEVLIVGYFDRLVRSIRVQGEVVSRVERAGGEVLAVDYGRISEETAVQWLSGTLVGAVHEYVRRSSTEKSAEAQADSVARGVVPFPSVPPGLALDETNRVVHTGEMAVVRKAFEMRAAGATIKEVRAFLRGRGIERSHHGVSAMLANRLYLGEIHFGRLVNLKAHKPAIERDLFNRVQRVRVPRGKRAKSDRLLARLGVLRCGTCGARMVVGTAHNGEYALYRCPPTGDCERRVTISAMLVEEAVVGAVRRIVGDIEGRASVEAHAREAERRAERSQADFESAIRAFAGLEDEAAAAERLAELRAIRDRDREEAEQLRGAGGTVTVASKDLDLLTPEEWRDLIRLSIETVTISPGRGRGRIHVKPFV